jgi:hypothetical protein
VGENPDTFFAQLTAPLGACANSDDDGWFERAGNDALTDDAAAAVSAERIGAAALSPDRELVPRAPRRRTRRRRLQDTPPARRRRYVPRFALASTGCVLLVLVIAVVTNRPTIDAAGSRSRGADAAGDGRSPVASTPTTPRAARGPAPLAATAAQRARQHANARRSARAAGRTTRQHQARRRRAARRASSTPTVLTPAAAPVIARAPAPAPPPAARRRAPQPSDPVPTPGDLAPSATGS